MQCPTDNTLLHMTTREGIEIDYCPACRGVWLDRGELDKIIERSSLPSPASGILNAQPRHENNPPHRVSQHYDDDQSYDDYQKHHKKHKRESFIGDLFDF